ncbi:hypothetical protein W97_04588 [Coniosporium apollinis CBS 100218]|uniref:4a-hydroxytetrahydrobiopterin dehydratase n=1 Tax=Coniosporium apollinis (strain CBS 100218) TaxID=1168221 RepID=R7YTX6_CONA1|nr:uncharacterized protein W97_04588 [Coniosporium apollinis CBS 100218]EON65350.1 hypothetical protein W97_04588 [Coniosporium apollinis CBS 100218]
MRLPAPIRTIGYTAPPRRVTSKSLSANPRIVAAKPRSQPIPPSTPPPPPSSSTQPQPAPSAPPLTPLFSAPSNPVHLTLLLTPLLAPHGPWRLTRARTGLARTFQFRSFNAAWGFMGAVATEAQKRRHHPTWSNTYNRVEVLWTTHKPEGLSELDVVMAGVCDREGEVWGEVRDGAEGRGGGGGGGEATGN